jgi:hypothetical protein
MPEVVSFTLPQFYFSSHHLEGEYWTQKAYGVSDNRGKQLRRDGFSFAEERYGTSDHCWSALTMCIADHLLCYPVSGVQTYPRRSGENPSRGRSG